MFGLLNIDKAAGMTSRDVVNRVQRLVKPHKVGHAGTLDPLATGVLVVAVGPATRLVEYVQRMPKKYQGTFLLGRASDTEDVEGTVVDLPNASVPTAAELAAAIPHFVGTIQQQPPAFSALKVAGQRSYDLARRGEAVELPERQIVVHELAIVRYEYPELELLVRCGSGTYIRSLGRDLARAVGTEAVMSALRRITIGPFSATDAIAYDQLTIESISERLLSPALALSKLPIATVNEAECRKLVQGQAIPDRWAIASDEAAAMNERGELVAILARHDRGGLRPVKGFLQDR